MGRGWEQLGLLATMQAAILNVIPSAPNFARSVWIGGIGLSICGVLIVQYFPIKAFTITDNNMRVLVQDKNPFISPSLLANALAGPVVIALWSSVLFLIGITDYIIETNLYGFRYQV